MSKLEKLIQQYCPDGVECVPLSSIGTIKRGNGLQKKDFVKSGIGCIHYGQIYTKFGLFTDKTLTYVDKELADHLLHIEKGDLVIACTSENIEDVCKAVAWLGDESIVTGGHSCVLHHNQNPKYIAYFFQTESFQRQKRKYAYGTKVIDIKPDSIGKIEIPVPPLPVQEEIVRVLDTFTELQAELQAELQKRKQQYNFYRDNLLNFKDINRGGQEIKWMKMSEVMSISRGASPRPIQNYLTDADDGIPWIKIGDVSPSSKYISSTKEKIKKEGATKSRYLKKGDFILSNSMSFGRPYILNIDGCIHDGWISMYGFEEYLDQNYLYYVLRSESVQTFWTAKANSGGAVSNLNSDIVRNTLIPIPPMEEQQRIADILDRFDTLTNDLTSGLPAEMEKRRQQYEFYRDKLLTFKRKEA